MTKEQYETYVVTVLRQIATALGITYEELTENYDDMPSCLICGQVAPFKTELANDPELGVCFQCSRGAEQAQPVAVLLEDARERLDSLISDSSWTDPKATRGRLHAIDAILLKAKRQLGHPHAGLERYQQGRGTAPDA